ncbi:uncharacterized protein LOC100680499 [Nasonia vitripennis]|uniref:Protein sleepless n=1 Tax=Nasonia vitripennis TaxID=7425 RepID=A0A7M7GF68_NASVI|nr:uncharacterized protein LOC100680499 [Nasonia vitripennis]XP_032454728.1 uncharacterized protein LOC100680499 [Nasonia vitripennis]XP_032454729.1 uncharacterized protein LOC100680499 [Nasonia vitripennis]
MQSSPSVVISRRVKMYFKKLSIPSPIVFGLLVLFSADQASARRCYACESTSTESCWVEGTSAPIETCVLPGRSLALNSATSSTNTTILEAMALLGHENSTSVGPKYYPTFDCGKLVGNFRGYNYVLRICTVEQIPCASYVGASEKLGFYVTGCHRCSGDLCNSSTSINAGITSLVVFATLFFFQK